MNWVFGRKSMEVYRELSRDLQVILDWGLDCSPVDFALVEGHRTPEKQFEYYKVGRKQTAGGKWVEINPGKHETITNCDGYKVLSKHNYLPSMAVDIRIHVLGKPSLSYDTSHVCLVAGVLIAGAHFLFSQGIIIHKLRWGGNWDKDGEILFDQEFDDLPHLELYKL